MVILEVLSRHLHPMTYPGHRAGVTADSSSQPGGVSPVTKLSTQNLIFMAKAKAFELSQLSNVQNADQLHDLKNALKVFLAI